MSEKEKEMTKPKKVSVPTFVGPEDAGQTAEKPAPQKPETNPEEYPLFKKLDKLIELLTEKENGITHQLCRVADALDKIVGKPVPTFVQSQVSPDVAKTIQSPPAPRLPKPATQPIIQPTAGTNQVEDTRMMFPQDLESLLVFEDKGDYIRITPRQFLGSDNFAKIAGIIRENGGVYQSEGKNSHFRIPE